MTFYTNKLHGGVASKITANAATAFGDSVTVGLYATSPNNNGWAGILKHRYGWNLDNFSVSSTQLIDQIDEIYSVFPKFTDNFIMLTGYNDMRNYGANAAKQTVYQNALTAAIAWLAIPDSIKVLGSSLGVDYGGSWNSTPVYGSIGKYTTSNGATATLYLYGSTIYLSFIAIATVGGSFSISIDGVSQGSFTCRNDNISAVSGLSYAPFLLSFGGLSDSLHTIVITTTSTNNFYFDWGAGIRNVDNFPIVLVGNCLRMNATGYAIGSPNWNNGNDSVVTSFNNIISSVVTTLATNGLRVYLVDASASYNLSTDVYTDNIHPNNTGHSHIATAFATVRDALTGLIVVERASIVGSAVYAESILASSFSVSNSTDIFQDTGLSIALPKAGTYKVYANIRQYINAIAPNPVGYIMTKLYNSTDSADVANSERMGVATVTGGVTVYENSNIDMIITVTAGKTIKLYAKRYLGGGVTYSSSVIASDVSGRSVMGYSKI